MKQELLDKLAAALSTRFKGNYTCPVCKHEQLMQACTGLFINILHENNLDPLRFGPNSIPTLPIICTNCGYITQHAVGVFMSNWEDFRKEFESQDKA